MEPASIARLGDRRHGVDVGLSRRLPIDPALAHHEDPEGRVRQLARDIHVEAAAGQAVEIFGVALPVPRQALRKDREGDVLDTFHQLDQSVVVAGLAGREADAAVAHHHGGDPVPGRGLHALVPGRLAVIVGVDVDEARRDHLSAGVDLLGARSRDPPDAGDNAILHADVGLRRAGRPCRRPPSHRGSPGHRLFP
jgi:hypothetical protein